MGTVSKRGIGKFGGDLGERIDGVPASVGETLDEARPGDGAYDRVRDRAALSHKIERAMSAVPSTTWLALAGASMVSSIALRLLGRHAAASFVGQWAPTFLVCGLYNHLTTVGAATALLSSRR